MSHSVAVTLGTCLAALTLAGCGSPSTADKIAASARRDYIASDVTCSKEDEVAVAEGKQYEVHGCLIVDSLAGPPYARSPFRRCYVYEGQPVVVGAVFLHDAAPDEKFRCLS
jgi:hypothetical protein